MDKVENKIDRGRTAGKKKTRRTFNSKGTNYVPSEDIAKAKGGYAYKPLCFYKFGFHQICQTILNLAS